MSMLRSWPFCLVLLVSAIAICGRPAAASGGSGKARSQAGREHPPRADDLRALLQAAQGVRAAGARRVSALRGVSEAVGTGPRGPGQTAGSQTAGGGADYRDQQRSDRWRRGRQRHGQSENRTADRRLARGAVAAGRRGDPVRPARRSSRLASPPSPMSATSCCCRRRRPSPNKSRSRSSTPKPSRSRRDKTLSRSRPRRRRSINGGSAFRRRASRSTSSRWSRPPKNRRPPPLPRAPAPKPKPETVVMAFVGAAPSVQIDWTPKAEGAMGLTALATVQTEQQVSIDEGVVRTRTQLAYTISRAELAELAIEVPADQKVLNVFDPNVKEWKVEQAGDLNKITVQLYQPAKENQRLLVEMEKFSDDLLQKPIAAPVVRALGVGRQQGVVVVQVAQTLRAEPATRVGLLQLDANELPPTLANTPWNFSFRFPAVPFELTLRAEKVQPQIQTHELVEAYLEPERLTLDLLALYKIERASVFQLELDVPLGFEVRAVRGHAAAGAEAVVVDTHHVTAGEKSQHVVVNLARKAIGHVGLFVELQRQLEAPNLLSFTGKSSSGPVAAAARFGDEGSRTLGGPADGVRAGEPEHQSGQDRRRAVALVCRSPAGHGLDSRRPVRAGSRSAGLRLHAGPGGLEPGGRTPQAGCHRPAAAVGPRRGRGDQVRSDVLLRDPLQQRQIVAAGRARRAGHGQGDPQSDADGRQRGAAGSAAGRRAEGRARRNHRAGADAKRGIGIPGRRHDQVRVGQERSATCRWANRSRRRCPSCSPTRRASIAPGARSSWPKRKRWTCGRRTIPWDCAHRPAARSDAGRQRGRRGAGLGVLRGLEAQAVGHPLRTGRGETRQYRAGGDPHGSHPQRRHLGAGPVPPAERPAAAAGRAAAGRQL